MEPAIRWAGNPNIIVEATIASIKVTIQVSQAPRIRTTSFCKFLWKEYNMFG